MMNTENLLVTALLPQQLAGYLENRGIEPEELEYVNDMIIRLLGADVESYVFHTFWVGVEKNSQDIVCELILKGEPVDGEVEIGYRCFDSGKGYMTEMVTAMTMWAEANDLKLKAKAENPASERVLEKSGFKRINDLFKTI